MPQKIRHALDKSLEKIISRKLLTWATATGLLFWGNLESEHWVYISCVYIGGQTVVDTVTRLKTAGTR